MQIHCNKDSKYVSDFVGDLFQELGCIRQTNDDSFIVTTDMKAPSFCIGKSADRAKKFILPHLFPFKMLVLSHG